MKLSEKERLFLYNQYEILKELKDGHEKEIYEQFQEIVSGGYEDLYEDLMVVIEEAVPRRITNFVFDVLNLYRTLMVSYHELSEEERAQIDENDIVYDGFDQNDEFEYYKFADFLMRKQKRYKEIYKDGAAELDSHASRLDQYKKMINTWEATGKKGRYENLTVKEIKNIVESYKI